MPFGRFTNPNLLRFHYLYTSFEAVGISYPCSGGGDRSKGKVVPSLQYYVMKMYGGVEGRLYTLLNSELGMLIHILSL
jgi:hypothetical protein